METDFTNASFVFIKISLKSWVFLKPLYIFFNYSFFQQIDVIFYVAQLNHDSGYTFVYFMHFCIVLCILSVSQLVPNLYIFKLVFKFTNKNYDNRVSFEFVLCDSHNTRRYS